jgi:hypothetical protein
LEKINIEKICKNQILRPKIKTIFKCGVIYVSVQRSTNLGWSVRIFLHNLNINLPANFLPPAPPRPKHTLKTCWQHSSRSLTIYINLTSNFAIQQVEQWSRCSKSNNGFVPLFSVTL